MGRVHRVENKFVNSVLLKNFTLKNWMVLEDLKLELDSAISVISDIMESVRLRFSGPGVYFV